MNNISRISLIAVVIISKWKMVDFSFELKGQFEEDLFNGLSCAVGAAVCPAMSLRLTESQVAFNIKYINKH